MNLACVYIFLQPSLLVKAQTQLCWQEFIIRVSTVAAPGVTSMSSQIISGNVLLSARWEVRYEVASWHTFLGSHCGKLGIHFNMDSTTQQLFVYGYLYKTRGLSALDSRFKKTYLETARLCVWGTPYTWMSDMTLILYMPKGRGTITIALYITIYSTYTC